MSRASRMRPGIFARLPPSTPMSAQDRIDQRGLDAIAKRRIDHFVGGAAPAIAARMTAIEAVDLEDADALDLLHRLDALAHDAFDAVEQLPPEQRVARRLGQHVLGLVEEPLRLGLDRRADSLGFRGDARLLGRLLGQQHLDRPAPAGDLGVAHRDDALLRFGGARFGVFRFGLRGRLLERLLIEGDRLVHQRRLDHLLAVDLELAQVALARRRALRRCRDRRRCGRARPPRGRRSRPPAAPGRARSPVARSTRRRSRRAASNACSRSTSLFSTCCLATISACRT